jgi:mono/diheme cytochrome c family protein
VVLCSAALSLSLASCSSSAPRSNVQLTPQQASGQRIYASDCASCHGTETTANVKGPSMKELYKKEFMPSGTPANDERVRDVIVHGKRMMPPFGQALDDPQINDLIAYLHTL